jgi:hypothetical protein
MVPTITGGALIHEDIDHLTEHRRVQQQGGNCCSRECGRGDAPVDARATSERPHQLDNHDQRMPHRDEHHGQVRVSA